MYMCMCSPAALNLDSAAVVEDLSLSKLAFAEHNCFSRPSFVVSAEAMESLRLHCNIECMHAGVCAIESLKMLLSPGFLLEPRRSGHQRSSVPDRLPRHTASHAWTPVHGRHPRARAGQQRYTVYTILLHLPKTMHTQHTL